MAAFISTAYDGKMSHRPCTCHAATRWGSLLSGCLKTSPSRDRNRESFPFVSPLGSVQSVRRWSPAQTQWSRPTARPASTASSSPTSCCSVAPVPTQHCSASALVVTTWRDRWRCAKIAYSSTAPPVGVAWSGVQWTRKQLQGVCEGSHSFLCDEGHIDHIYCFPAAA